MREHLAITSLIASLGTISNAAIASDWKYGAEVSVETRYFPNEPLNEGQFSDFQPSLVLQPEARWESDNRKHQLVLVPFFRLDGQDDERTHFDLREAFYRFKSDQDWSLTVGAAKIFWGRTESRHLVDIINQTDSIEDIDEEDKLGQPMINLTVSKEWGALDFFVMSGFRDRSFPGFPGRLRFGLTIDTDDPIFERDDRRAAIDLAGRYSHFIGNWDFGLSIFHGTSREARFAVDETQGRLLPVYDLITQGSIDFQYTQGAWLWKVEALARSGHGEVFLASVAGFEYTLYQFAGTNFDLGLLAEYQYDGRDEGLVIEELVTANGSAETLAVLAAPVTPADNDVFLGARLALNDTQSSAILVGGTIDSADQSIGMFVEAERRFGQNWTASLEARLFVNVDRDNILNAFRDDDFLNLRVTRYF